MLLFLPPWKMAMTTCRCRGRNGRDGDNDIDTTKGTSNRQRGRPCPDAGDLGLRSHQYRRSKSLSPLVQRTEVGFFLALEVSE